MENFHQLDLLEVMLEKIGKIKVGVRKEKQQMRERISLAFASESSYFT
jgi:hypothetical protein